jgi:TolB-like protein/tetratricopeptide (TPR) repeat protein
MPDDEALHRAARSSASADDVLDSWKDIAVYLQRDVRTVMRWEQARGLPVHRLPGGPKAAVFALKSELEGWRAARSGAAGDAAEGEGRRPALLRRPLLVAAAALALVLAIVLPLRLAGPPRGAGAPAIRSLAVLPFQNLNHDPAQDYFADGMHETLITGLARASGVPVTARTSVEHYRGSRTPTRQIARELGVDALVEGSVLRVGDRVRITAQLVRGDTEEHVWADQYDRDVADVLMLMAQVSDDITREVRKALAGRGQQEPGAAPRTIRPDVLDSYLRARSAHQSLTEDGLARAAMLYRQTTRLDPNVALVWSGLAAARFGQAFFGFAPAGEALPEARNAARRALTLDDRLGEAYTSLGSISLYWDRDTDTAGSALERAVALSPNSMMTRHGYADYLLARGNAEASLEQVRAGLVCNPMSASAHGIVLYHSLMARRYQDVVRDAASIPRSGAATASLDDWVGRALWLEGRHEEALARWRTAFGIGDETYRGIEGVYRLRGATAAMLALAEWTAAREPKDLQSGAVHAASLFAAAGDAERALQWLQLSYTRGEPFLLHVAADPFFDPLRTDARFQAVLRRLGIGSNPR